MITFKYVRELYDNERKHRQKLQEIDADFFDKVKEYIERKKKLINKPSLKTIAIQQELQNFESIVHNLLELRQKKIMELALKHVNAQLKVDESKFLEHEKVLFYSILELLRRTDKYIGEMLEGKSPNIELISLTSASEVQQPEITNEEQSSELEQTKEEQVKDPSFSSSSPQPKKEQTIYKSIDEILSSKEYVMVEVLYPLPSFLAHDKQFYGPYGKGERVMLPSKTVKVLLEMNKVRVIE